VPLAPELFGLAHLPPWRPLFARPLKLPHPMRPVTSLGPHSVDRVRSHVISRPVAWIPDEFQQEGE